jgi:hypothetical protein
LALVGLDEPGSNEMSITALFFLFLFLAGLLLAFLKHPIYGVFSYLLVFYMSPGEAWWSSDIPDLRWSLLAGVFTITAAIRHPAPPSRPPWYLQASIQILIAFTIWVWIQTPWAMSMKDHIFFALLFTKYILLYVMLYTCFTDPLRIRQFIFAHVIGCFLWGYLAFRNPGSGRLEKLGAGDVAGSAFASMQLGTGLAFAGYAFIGNSGIGKWIAFSSLPFILNAIILMATRGAFVGLLVGAPAAIFFSSKPYRRTVTICLALAGILLLVLGHELFWERMSTIPLGAQESLEASAASRVDIARANVQMFWDHPMGVGHRGNDLLSPRYMPDHLLTEKAGIKVRSAHNTLMAVLVDHGFVGIILFVLFHASIARSLIRLRTHCEPISSNNLGIYTGTLGTSLLVYWGNAQFANFTKAEVVIWIAALSGALEWMANADFHLESRGTNAPVPITLSNDSAIANRTPE